ncbi:unnamed protein product [Candidula unifasciata]|uniref:CTCK domain-containing protein n=1 Tax=Candidula unifasciata TaxID=100452 RepID=A0A8S3YMM9_9EUPU|nr:unnamed protein product [Candidula unifasciata]
MVVALASGNVNALCSRMMYMKKCEGVCRSYVYPSVQTHNGFGRVCRCCKENATITRDVLMTCVSGGQEIPNFQQAVTIREITGCNCVNCND